MEGNDIGTTVHKHVACWFEGLLMMPVVEEVPEKKRFWQRKDEALADDKATQALVNTWQTNELPVKSVIHMINQMGLGVEVYTYYDESMVPVIESWLSRKGIDTTVYAYRSVRELLDDFKYNRDVHTLYTPYEDDAKIVGWHRATVVLPDGTFGF